MLSEALRLIRVFHDVKQNELAEKFKVSKSFLSEVESGKKNPTIEFLKNYQEEFNIPVSSILFFSEQLDDTKKEKARSKISRKVIRFLKLIEERTQDARA